MLEHLLRETGCSETLDFLKNAMCDLIGFSHRI